MLELDGGDNVCQVFREYCFRGCLGSLVWRTAKDARFDGIVKPPGMEESAWCVGDALAAWGKRGLSRFPWIVWGYQKLAIHWMALTESVVMGIMDSVPVLGAQSIGWAYKAFLALCVMDPDFRVGV